MKAITICQPWAWLIIHGPKRVENRTWALNYRGPLLIHAGKSTRWLRDRKLMAELRRLAPGLATAEARGELVKGAIIGRVEMVDCVHIEHYRLQRLVYRQGADPWASGPWCHVYADAVEIEPVECAGGLSLWDAGAVMGASVDFAAGCR